MNSSMPGICVSCMWIRQTRQVVEDAASEAPLTSFDVEAVDAEDEVKRSDLHSLCINFQKAA